MKNKKNSRKENSPRRTNNKNSQSVKAYKGYMSGSDEGENVVEYTIVNVDGRRVRVRKVKNISEYMANNKPAVRIIAQPTNKYTGRSDSNILDYVRKCFANKNEDTKH